MVIEYTIAGIIQLIILYNIFRGITTWSDDQSIDKKFRNSDIQRIRNERRDDGQ